MRLKRKKETLSCKGKPHIPRKNRYTHPAPWALKRKVEKPCVPQGQAGFGKGGRNNIGWGVQGPVQTWTRTRLKAGTWERTLLKRKKSGHKSAENPSNPLKQVAKPFKLAKLRKAVYHQRREEKKKGIGRSQAGSLGSAKTTG